MSGLERRAHSIDFAESAGGGYVLHCVVSGGEHSAHGFEARVQNRLADRFALEFGKTQIREAARDLEFPDDVFSHKEQEMQESFSGRKERKDRKDEFRTNDNSSQITNSNVAFATGSLGVWEAWRSL